jgi:hypothetical protein
MDICTYCGRPINDDEAQLIRDRLTVAVAPMQEMLGLTTEETVKSLLADAAICATCFNRNNEQQPLEDYVKDLIEHPTHIPRLFQFTLVRKGARHGMG